VGAGVYGEVDRDSFCTDRIGDLQEMTRVDVLADGRVISVTRRDMASGGRVVTHDDITVRQKLSDQLTRQNEFLRQREAELRSQNDQLDAAFNNMSQGLAMYDASKSLVVCNKVFRGIYGLSAEQSKPGTTIRHLFSWLPAKGLTTEQENKSFFRSWKDSSATTTTRLLILSDGRVLSVSSTRMANAGRVVLTEDVTERERALCGDLRPHPRAAWHDFG
jgi:PAS domain-containing protein